MHEGNRFPPSPAAVKSEAQASPRGRRQEFISQTIPCIFVGGRPSPQRLRSFPKGWHESCVVSPIVPRLQRVEHRARAANRAPPPGLGSSGGVSEAARLLPQAPEAHPGPASQPQVPRAHRERGAAALSSPP